MAYSDHEQALRVASPLSAVTTGCCLRYGLFASILRQPVSSVNSEDYAFCHYYDLLRTIGLSTTEDMIHPTRTWLICRLGVLEPAERYFLQGFHRWHVEWIEVVAAEGIVLPSDPVLMSLQTIMGLSEEVRDHGENSGRVRLVAQPGAVSLDRVAQQYAWATAGISTDQLLLIILLIPDKGAPAPAFRVGVRDRCIRVRTNRAHKSEHPPSREPHLN